MDFVNVLEAEYNKRLEANKSYSLRAFARDLHIDQSSLSKVLARKRILTNDLILRISSNLGISAARAKKYLNASNVTITHPAYKDLEYERFVAISDWYHDAILELIDTESFKPDSKWIAERLEIKESQVKSAIRRLIKLGFLAVDKNGQWADRSKVNSIHPEDTSPIALKNYQKQVLSKSLEAIDAVDLPKRSHTSITFSASSENIEEAKILITKCRKDIAALLRSSKNPKTDVFQLQISLFPITNQKKGVKS